MGDEDLEQAVGSWQLGRIIVFSGFSAAGGIRGFRNDGLDARPQNI